MTSPSIRPSDQKWHVGATAFQIAERAEIESTQQKTASPICILGRKRSSTDSTSTVASICRTSLVVAETFDWPMSVAR